MLSTSQDTKPVHCKSIPLILLIPTADIHIQSTVVCYTHIRVIDSFGSDMVALVIFGR